MIHPSYNELFDKINENTENAEPIGSSRYSICVATAKRARQLIDKAEPLAKAECNKPLSIAIEEIYEGKVQILSTSEETAELDTNASDTEIQ